MSDLTTFVAEVDKYIAAQHKKIGQNLLRAGAYILRESQKIVPVHTGKLRASGFVRSTGSGIATVVSVGYTAAYAVYVHEIIDNLHGAAFNTAYADKIAANPGHHYWFERGPNQQALFLSTILVGHRANIRNIITMGL